MFAAEVMRRHGIPEDLVIALRAVSAGFRGYGRGAEVSRVLHDGETLELRDRRLEVQHRPGPQPDRHRALGRRPRDPARRRPPDRPHLLEPAAQPRRRRPRRRAPARARHLHREPAADARAAGAGDPARPRRAGRRPPGADRLPLRAPPPPRRQALGPDPRRADDRARARAQPLGQRRRHPGLPHPERGDRPPRPARRRRPRGRARGGRDPLRGRAGRASPIVPKARIGA